MRAKTARRGGQAITGNSVSEQKTVKSHFYFVCFVRIVYIWRMMHPLFLPIASHNAVEVKESESNSVHRVFDAWLNEKIKQLHVGFSCTKPDDVIDLDTNQLTQNLVDVLTHRTFNYQSKKNGQHLLPSVQQTMAASIALGQPIPFLYLYNGGYRASPFPNDSALIFTPDVTELMLLYQIAMLQQSIQPLYSPGIVFTIVINNGVAQDVNDVPVVATEQYVQQLRAMINWVGAEKTVRVLVQSELQDIVQEEGSRINTSITLLSDKEHATIERFMGRAISREEASIRALRYTQAEALWFDDLNKIARSQQAILLRQIADGSMLSFRPFPGGAIRSQNGSLGFEYINDTIRLKLITTESGARRSIVRLPMVFPWQTTTYELIENL